MQLNRDIISYAQSLMLITIASMQLLIQGTSPILSSDTLTDKEVWITVLVHGIIVINPGLVAENIAPLMVDKAKQTRYGKTVEYARKNPILFQNQPMQEEGLKIIDLSRHEQGYGAGALANVLESIAQDIEDTPRKRLYYTFGWSGLLSHSSRIDAGKLLFEQLNAEIKRLRQQGITPHIRLIGYSHGGNVCLQIARAAKECGVTDWQVDELILLATPIQKESDCLISEPIFKRSYSVYSESDHVQRLDFFSYNRFFSRKKFKKRPDLVLPTTLTQIRIKIRKHLKNSQILNDPVRYLVSKNHRAVSPGHIEFWFYGWTPKYYRKCFPFNPMPVVALVPYIIHQVTTTQEEIVSCKPIVVTIAPAYEQMNIENTATGITCATDFMTIDRINELKDLILRFKPNHYRKKYYKARNRIYKKAKEAHQQARFETICETLGRCGHCE